MSRKKTQTTCLGGDLAQAHATLHDVGLLLLWEMVLCLTHEIHQTKRVQMSFLRRLVPPKPTQNTRVHCGTSALQLNQRDATFNTELLSAETYRANLPTRQSKPSTLQATSVGIKVWLSATPATSIPQSHKAAFQIENGPSTTVGVH